MSIFIKRPVLAISFNILLVVCGLASFGAMPVRQFPMMDTSVLTVTTIYPGASGALMSGFITTPIESAISNVAGIDYTTSSSMQNSSLITVNLKLGYPIQTAMTDIANQVQSVKWLLPFGTQDSVLSKSDPNATPSLYIAFQGQGLSDSAITDYINRVVKPSLSTLPGVGEVRVMGERQFAMRVNLSPEKMAVVGLTAHDVWQTLKQQSLQAASGTLKSHLHAWNVVLNSELKTASAFNHMPIVRHNDRVVRLQEVGQTVLGSENYSSSAILNGSRAIFIGIIPASDANPLSVSQLVIQRLNAIKHLFIPGLSMKVAYDTALFIAESIREVYKTMLEAAVCVLIVVIVFLGSFRAVLVPLMAIPVSLIGVCTMMHGLHYSVNTITLLAWVLAIGLVVDDAIVVLENIHRHLHHGLSPLEATIKGTQEITWPVIAMTVTLIAVYAPIGFSGGLTGALFTEFAFTLAGTVGVSGVTALTLSPILSQWLLTTRRTRLQDKVDNWMDRLSVKYIKSLNFFLKHQKRVAGGSLAGYILCAFWLSIMPTELAPMEDQNAVLLWGIGPSATSLHYTEYYTKQLHPLLDALPERSVYAIINGFNGPNSVLGFINLKPWNERSRGTNAIQRALFSPLRRITGMEIFPLQPQPLPTSGGIMPLQFVLKSNDRITSLEPVIQALKKDLNAMGGFANLDIDYKPDKPLVNVTVDREKAAILSVDMDDVANELNVLLGEPETVQFSMDDRSYYVIPSLDLNFDEHAHPLDLQRFFVKNTDGSQFIALSNIVHLTESIEVQSVAHFQQMPSITLSANLSPGFSLGDAVTWLTQWMKQHYPNVAFDFAGQARQFVESSHTMVRIMIFAILLIFLLLSSQFESFRDALVILSVAPLTIAGALTVAYASGVTLNIYSQIGITTLIGLIAKHGILIVEFANQLVHQHHYTHCDAAIEAARLRLRPILMTTGAMVLGALPLALAGGAGASARHAIGWILVGGMSIGTFFSLFIVPVLYTLGRRTV
jgi:multidrug efflux pump